MVFHPTGGPSSLALLTDLYQLTMACGYWEAGMAGREAVFHLIFRRHPFEGGYTVACGLAAAVEFIRHLHFDSSDIDYLRSVRGGDDQRLFPDEFLEHLDGLKFSCDVDAIPEGTVVFPHEPLVRVRGPLLECQLLETALLNLINFQTLIATKAARIAQAAQGDAVLEFGLRRAQGVDGGVSASRAAFVGGCPATSNVLAGKLYGIPVQGTHAHSWVMAFDSEAEAFETWGRVMPYNGIFLVDTYDTIEGVKEAIRIGRQMRERGHQLAGIRLDSGDLRELSIEARRLLDSAGFPGAAIVASGDLDEHAIEELKRSGARINVWGVGTKLATAYDEPALGGVYKLSALRGPDGEWRYKLKLSEEMAKISDPGILQVRRFQKDGKFVADAVYDEPHPPASGWEIAPLGLSEEANGKTGKIPSGAESENLLAPIFRQGRCVYENPALTEVQQRCQRQLAALPDSMKRLQAPEVYPVGLEKELHQKKLEIMERLHAQAAPGAAP